jgi:hypothetical protein
MKTLLCLLTGHKFSPWQLYTAYFGREITKDATRRTCTCCGRTESQIIPFKRFNISK